MQFALQPNERLSITAIKKCLNRTQLSQILPARALTCARTKARSHFVPQTLGPQIEREQTPLISKVHRHRRRAVAQLEISIGHFERFSNPPTNGERPPRIARAFRHTSTSPHARRIFARDIDVSQRSIRLPPLYVKSRLMPTNEL